MRQIRFKIGRAVSVVLSILVVVVLLSCQADEPAPTSVPPTPTTPSTEISPTPTVADLSDDSPQYGGTLNWLAFGTGSDPESWDLLSEQYGTEVYLGFVYEKLFSGDLKYGPHGTNQYLFDQTFVPIEFLRGYLAESYEEYPPEHVIINLRQGVKWQDKPPTNGREFVADDLVANLTWRMEESTAWTAAKDMLESVEAIDDYTVEIRFKNWEPNWLESLFVSYGGLIWPPELAEVDSTDWRNQAGTGPFILSDYVSGVSVTYAKNPNYWEAIVIDGEEFSIPFADEVKWHLIHDFSSQVAALRAGELDILGLVPWDQAQSLWETNPELNWASNFGARTQNLRIRFDKPPLHDKGVRHALSMAIDRDAFCNLIHGGDCILRNYPYPPKVESLFVSHEDLPESTRQIYEYDPEMAKDLLAEAGYPDGFETEIVAGSSFVESAELIVEYWKQIGVQATIRVIEDGEVWTVQRAGAFDQFLLSTGTPWGPAQFVINTEPGYIWNPSWPDISNVEDPEMQEILRPIYDRYYEFREELESAENIEDYYATAKELGLWWTDEMPFLVLPTGKVYTFWQPWVMNYTGAFNMGYAHLAYPPAWTWIDQEMKSEALGR
jgi:peptide/nickel transport system substrate-binding protein